ncbi:hypothetical protein NDU88_006133 [Pleurodeles waltl]|uniref:Uncharacterized protein n=1 Tax=Pleurodeles waltl TaxID=8319 RepID=A0AAV7RL22_PLEWA|nr:hypothetical protein NDU88_006133 [Pleurodeles waltl]
MEQLPPVVGSLGGQSHLARACTVTLVPGLRVGHQAAGSSHLFHFQRAPSGVQGSGDVRVKAPSVFASPDLLGSIFLYRASAAPGDGAVSPVVGTLGGQSHPARARSVTLVPGLKVGRQAAGSSHLFHFQRAPSGAQGSSSGSLTGQLLLNGSVDGP